MGKTADEKGLGSRVNFQHASVYAVPFPDNSFDVVIMSDVLEHLLDLKKALREVARVLKPGGVFLYDTLDRSVISFIVAILGAEHIVQIIIKGSHDWRLFIRPEELKVVLSSTGFHDFTCEAFDPSF